DRGVARGSQIPPGPPGLRACAGDAQMVVQVDPRDRETDEHDRPCAIDDVGGDHAGGGSRADRITGDDSRSSARSPARRTPLPIGNARLKPLADRLVTRRILPGNNTSGAAPCDAQSILLNRLFETVLFRPIWAMDTVRRSTAIEWGAAGPRSDEASCNG